MKRYIFQPWLENACTQPARNMSLPVYVCRSGTRTSESTTDTTGADHTLERGAECVRSHGSLALDADPSESPLHRRKASPARGCKEATASPSQSICRISAPRQWCPQRPDLAPQTIFTEPLPGDCWQRSRGKGEQPGDLKRH